MEFILGLIIFFLILRAIPQMLLWWVRRKIKKANPDSRFTEDTVEMKKKSKKNIDKDKGDYVDFEEI